jgi:Zn-dependent peptidase ImmA (M78 family)
MGDVNLFTIDLIKKMQAKYFNDVDTAEYKKGRDLTAILVNRFASNSLKENEPVSPDATSYTINKGDVIGICLREKQTGQNNFHHIDDIKFVLLHELAHIVTPEYSHTPLFWTNFRFLLEFCKSHGLYNTPDYAARNIEYCGTTITYNPMDDKDLVSYFQISKIA